MNAVDLHLYFNQLVQESGDYQSTTFLPEKVDTWLNTGMFQLLDEYFPDDPVRKGYGNNILASELLGSLEKTITDSLYVDRSEVSMKGYIPQDYYRSIAVGVKSNPYCSTPNTSVSTKTFNYWVVKLKTLEELRDLEETLPITDNLKEFVITGESQLISDSSVVGDVGFFQLVSFFPTGYPNLEDYNIINNLIMQYGGDPTNFVRVYYERFNNLYFKDCFIFVQTPNSLLTKIENVKVFYSNTEDHVVSNNIPKQTFNDSTILVSGTSRLINHVRFLDSEFEGISSIDPLNASTKKSPYCHISGNKIVFYHYNKFNMSEMTLRYLRTPKMIDYNINQGLDFGLSYGSSRTIGERIVKRAVELAAIYTRAEIAQRQ